MSFASLLRHEVLIRRRTAVLDAGEPTYDELGQPITVLEAIATVRCRIEPKDAKEIALLQQGGAVVSTHTIFMLPTDLSEADQLVPQPADGRLFEVQRIDDGGGAGHHLEVDARLVTSDEPAEPS